MLTRREAVVLLAAMSGGKYVTAAWRDIDALLPSHFQDSLPALAGGAPMSPERLALIDAFKRKSDGVETRFEARKHTGDWPMPYRLFRPSAPGKLPLVVFLHGSGALGDDNLKQLSIGNLFGTRLWALGEIQKNFPCYVVAPQTDKGWVNYAPAAPSDTVARVIPGLGAGARTAFEIIDGLRHEFPIDAGRIYIMGQSMGGAGVWNMTANRPTFFAAAVTCCGSVSSDDAATSAGTPAWNFHGDADTTVPVTVSRERIAALRKVGAHPVSTEYAGVNHNSWEWAFTEPALPQWVFSKRRTG